MNKSSIKILLLSLPLAIFCSCAVGPDFEKPEYDNNPESWRGNPEEKANRDSAHIITEEELVNWWSIFDDPQLTDLIERAFKSNLDIETAIAKIRQARAGVGINQSGLFPSIDLNGSAMDRAPSGMSPSHMRYGVGAGASWEIDVFGGTRRSVESTVAKYHQSLADKCATRISVAGEVARNYFRYRALQEQIDIAKDNLQTQKKTYRITQERKANGFVSQLDVVRAAAQVETTSAEIPDLERQLEQTRHTIEFLLALNPNSLKDELSNKVELPSLEKYIPQVVPAKLIERRPDIVSAQYAIHAAVAQIGFAEADYYPRFFITGNVAYSAPRVGDMFQNQYGTWSVGPSFNWNIFQAGKTYYNVEQSEALAQSASIAWKKTVLQSLKEVEDSLVAASKECERIAFINRVVTSQKKAFELSSILYSEGEIEFLDLLDSQRSMLTSELSQVGSRRLLIDYMIQLYMALGGGWSEQDMIDENKDEAIVPLML